LSYTGSDGKGNQSVAPRRELKERKTMDSKEIIDGVFFGMENHMDRLIQAIENQTAEHTRNSTAFRSLIVMIWCCVCILWVIGLVVTAL
jgi:hypothetical protein